MNDDFDWGKFWNEYFEYSIEKKKEVIPEKNSENNFFGTLFKNGIPKDKLTILVGEPSKGKTTYDYLSEFTDLWNDRMINDDRKIKLDDILND